jgi:hypothetical protein
VDWAGAAVVAGAAVAVVAKLGAELTCVRGFSCGCSSMVRLRWTGSDDEGERDDELLVRLSLLDMDRVRSRSGGMRDCGDDGEAAALLLVRVLVLVLVPALLAPVFVPEFAPLELPRLRLEVPVLTAPATALR